jgi:hypothetical protein
VLRRRVGAFDDASLYRFARGQNTPAELVDPDAWTHGGPWLTVAGSKDVLVLGAHRASEGTVVDLYNTLRKPVQVVLGGPALKGRTAHITDMLGRVLDRCPGGRVDLEPLAYLQVVLS